MRNRIITTACVAGLVLSACGVDANQADLDEPTFVDDVATNIEARSPDSVTVFLNVDNHPNVVRLCMDGVAFRTISLTYSGGLSGPVERVEAWDPTCPQNDR